MRDRIGVGRWWKMSELRYRALERHRGKSLITNTFFKFLTHVFDDEETHFAHIL